MRLDVQLNEFERKAVLNKIVCKYEVLNLLFDMDWINRGYYTCCYVANGILCAQRIIYSFDVSNDSKPSLADTIDTINKALLKENGLIWTVTNNKPINPVLLSTVCESIMSDFRSTLKFLTINKIIDLKLSSREFSSLDAKCYNMAKLGSSPADIYRFLWQSSGIDTSKIIEIIKSDKNNLSVGEIKIED